MSYISPKRLDDYWITNFVGAEAACSLCGNRGVIDTRGVRTYAGVEVGRLNWCLCPNGRVMRKHANGALPQTLDSHGSPVL